MTQNKLVLELGIVPTFIFFLSLILISSIDLTKDDIKMFIPIFTFFSVFTHKNIAPNRSNAIVGFALTGLFFSVLTTLVFDSMSPTDMLLLKILFFITVSLFFYLVYINARRLKLFDQKK
jgi:hypothetical protein